jgi:hypothetical protein
MTTDIPDDVVDRAWAVFHDFSMTQEEAMRAAGRVFVEWEQSRESELLRTLDDVMAIVACYPSIWESDQRSRLVYARVVLNRAIRSHTGCSPQDYVDMRAALRVGVEWERQRLLGEVRHLEEDGLNGGWRIRTAKEIEAAIRSHTNPDEGNPSEAAMEKLKK